jgi:hypothetical protein
LAVAEGRNRRKRRIRLDLTPRLRPYASVFCAAFAVRVILAAFPGMLLGPGSYDEGVYYTAGRLLWQGMLPYRDYTLVHPPAIVWLSAPGAAIGAATSDWAALLAARVLSMVSGAACAAAVVWLCRRWGRRPALAAGYAYALWLPQVFTDQHLMLEVPINAALIAAMIMADRFAELPRARLALGIGVALGFALSVKLWAAGPALVLLVFVGSRGGWRRAAGVVGGAAISFGTMAAPIMAADVAGAFRQVVLAQMHRQPGWWTLRHQLDRFGPSGVALLVVACAAVLGWLVMKAKAAPARQFIEYCWAGIGLSVLAQIVAAPSWFIHYLALMTPSGCVLFAAWLARERGRERVRIRQLGVWAGVLLAVWTLICGMARRGYADYAPAWEVGEMIAAESVGGRPGCVWATNPAWLAAADAMPNDWRSCRTPVDHVGMILMERAGLEYPEGAGSAEAELLAGLDASVLAVVEPSDPYAQHLVARLGEEGAPWVTDERWGLQVWRLAG